MSGHVAGYTLEFLYQGFDNRVDTLPGLGMRLSQPVAFGTKHHDQLATACNQGSQRLLLDGRQRFYELLSLRMAVNYLAELSQNTCIDAIRLRQFPDGACKIPCLSGLMIATA
jgi:hypothetical protein